MTVSALYDVLADVLADSVAALVAAGITPPDRQYVSLGQPAAGACCEQIAVHLERLYPTADGTSDLSGRLVTCTAQATALVVVTVFRCTHGPDGDGNDPSPADLEADSLAAYSDGWVIWRALLAGSVGADCGGGAMGPLAPVGPSGNCGGVTVRTYRPVSD